MNDVKTIIEILENQMKKPNIYFHMKPNLIIQATHWQTHALGLVETYFFLVSDKLL